MNEFQEVIKKLIALFQEFNGVEQMKLQAASQNRVATVEECMIREQAMVLKLKGLEKERESAQKELGYADFSFRELLEQVSPQDKEQLEPLFKEFGREIEAFQDVSQNAAQVIEVNLHQIQKAFDMKEGSLYTDKGSAVNAEQHMTNRRV